ncbi:MAG TPA: cytochrome c biogenesis protein CcsA, partial [Pirellulaceae bacterium]|nr:cytochrome c biogenesis protein CcsA [Pirellulaceae bacterium]
RGLHLKYVSPRQILHSEKLREYLRDLHDRENTPNFTRTETDKLVYEMMNRYDRYRAITLNPTLPLTAGLVVPPGGRKEFLSQLNKVIELIDKPNSEGKTFLKLLEFIASLPEDKRPDKPNELSLREAAGETYNSLTGVMQVGGELFGQFRSDAEGGTEVGEVDSKLTLAQASTAVVRMRVAVEGFEKVLAEHRSRLFDGSQNLSSGALANLGPLFRELADKTRDLRLRTLELNVALYEDGNCVRVVPALNAGALSKTRDPAVKSQPWYSLAAVLYADELLVDYPQSKVRAVRNSWAELKSSYNKRESSDRPKKVAAAERAFYDSLADLGNAVEPLREKLVETTLTADERDAAIMQYTRWPDEAGLARVAAEVRYNQIDPFGRTWVISLIALACFSLSFGALRKPFYTAAVVVLCLSILWSAYGFYLRVYVTQWAPVTNMYETVVWVSFVVAVLGAWFLLLPLTWPGIKDAWRITALPKTFEETELDRWQLKKFSESGWFVANCVFGVARALLMVYVFYFLAIDRGYSDGARTIFALTPNLQDVGGSAGQVAQQLMVWVVGFCCLLLSVWFVPRLAFTTLASLVFIPWDLMLRRGTELSNLGGEVFKRWPIGVGATIMSAFGAWVTWMAPSVLDESFSPLQPVLRSNFWLTVHVLTIVSSYAAGMLAFGIGLIALGYYLFGRYRDPVVMKHVPVGMRPAGHEEGDEDLHLSRRPPEEVAALAQYAYRAIQVAVLLLAIGTILGGIWADRSWGRFWGWDPKEVWALVSLLVYLAILHGRFAGWFNNFGMITGTILGAGAILFSWYGVNFALPMLAPDGMVGLHSYGSGAGGLMEVAATYAITMLYWGAACTRYVYETSSKVTPLAEDAERVLSKDHVPTR